MSRELTPAEDGGTQPRQTYRKSSWAPLITAVKRYELVASGDRNAACISGGKDSMALAKLMQELQAHTSKHFGLEFMVMDPGYEPEDRKLIEDNAALLSIPVTIFNSDIFAVIASAGKGPCYLCTRMRRGALYAKVQELGCNKIALGRHLQSLQCACRFTEERDAAGDGVGHSKRQEIRFLLRELKKTSPNIEKSTSGETTAFSWILFLALSTTVCSISS